MQPLYCFTGTGTPAGNALQDMARLMNYAMKDRPFKFLQAVIVPEATELGMLTNNITMIFEAETPKALSDLLYFMEHDDNWRQMTGARPIRLIK